MANEEHLEMLKLGVETWNKWRSENSEVFPDLRHANLADANLENVNLSQANLNAAVLDRAVLVGARLREAKLNGSSLCEADLSRADLYHASLRASNLGHANLSKANLGKTNFFRADLSHSNLTKAHVTETVFSDLDLSLVIGLDAVKHFGPSSIDIDTLYRSRGEISDAFLRGCGVPDDFIAIVPTFFDPQKAKHFYSCFISYSAKDEEFANELHRRLQEEHLRVWFAPEDIRGGQKILEQIEHAVQLYDRLLLVLSESSMQSQWVITEIRNALRIEIAEKRRKLFPIRLVDFETIKEWRCFDSDTGRDLAILVREYYIPDFSNWRDTNYFDFAFDRLLRDLRAEEE